MFSTCFGCICWSAEVGEHHPVGRGKVRLTCMRLRCGGHHRQCVRLDHVCVSQIWEPRQIIHVKKFVAVLVVSRSRQGVSRGDGEGGGGEEAQGGEEEQRRRKSRRIGWGAEGYGGGDLLSIYTRKEEK